MFSTCEEFSGLKLHWLAFSKQGMLRIPEYYWWELGVCGWMIGLWAGNYFIAPKLGGVPPETPFLPWKASPYWPGSCTVCITLVSRLHSAYPL